ncbi:MAG: methyl-accepting chemotaxis protein, partial [Thiohalomonadales bacterium]
GFAVVAYEVRHLANRTQQSTQDIKKMIDNLQTGSGDAAKIMQTEVQKVKPQGKSSAKFTQTLSVNPDTHELPNESISKTDTQSTRKNVVDNRVRNHVNKVNSVAATQMANTSGIEIKALVSQLANEVSKFKR